ncbi:MAG TPA: glucosamine-6-phosphate deaminase [Vicinamibacterales bacterium]|nr:glucosamine-6-phosphate deaminase [Vicinamibacterales bacterium]
MKESSPERWADYVAETLISRLQVQPTLRLCLPTGLTPVPIYERVARAVSAGRVSFKHAEVFLLDEFGGVEPGDPGRCDQMLRRFLLDRVDLPDERFHRFSLDGDIEAECQAYEQAIGSGCDLALLGLGENGHIGMNEPGSPVDSLTRRVDLAPETTAATARYFSHDRLPTWGVTMGIATIMRSREVWLIAAGTRKKTIVRRTVRDPISTQLPASLLRGHPTALLIVDNEAGGEI